MPAHVVFYGSLQSGLHLGGEPPFAPLVRYVAPCRLAGRLYEVADGAYPALELLPTGSTGDGSGDVVHGELHEVLDRGVLDVLDEWEGYDPADPDASAYLRRAVRLLHPEVEAWVYVGHRLAWGRRIADGDWRAHRARRAG